MKVVVGGLIHNRPQVEAYLRHLRRLETADHEVEWVFVLDGIDWNDQRHQDLPWPASANLLFDGMDEGERPWSRRETQKPGCFAHLARLRNALREEVLDRGADGLLNVDSDIIVPSDLLLRLTNAGHPWVSALVRNRPGDKRVWNVLKVSEREGQPTWAHFPAIGNGPHGTCWPGPGGAGRDPAEPGGGRSLVVGAVCWYSSELLEKVPFAAHQHGEDWGFGMEALRQGYEGWYLPIRCEHLMYADAQDAKEHMADHIRKVEDVGEFLLDEHVARCEICR